MSDHQLDNPPTVLYKYYSFEGANGERVSRVISHREVFFSPRRYFNDPHDCRPLVSVDGTQEEYEALFLRLISEDPDFSQWSQERRAAAARSATAKYCPGRREDQERFGRNVDNALDSVGLLCLSETQTNPAMWAHYADKHRGICVGFRFLAQLFDGEDFPGHGVYRVRYDTERPVVRTVEEPHQAAATMVSVKSTDWTYEREWRIINFNGWGVHRLRDQFFESITVGANAEETLIEQIVEWLSDYRRYRPAVFRAQLNPGGFGVTTDVIEAGIDWRDQIP